VFKKQFREPSFLRHADIQTSVCTFVLVNSETRREEHDAALREAKFPAQAEKSRATYDRAKSATSGGRGVVILERNADEDALQEVIWKAQ